MEEKCMTVEIGIVMSRKECEDILRKEYLLTFDDFDTEDDAFELAANAKYNEGYGFTVR